MALPPITADNLTKRLDDLVAEARQYGLIDPVIHACLTTVRGAIRMPETTDRAAHYQPEHLRDRYDPRDAMGATD